MTDDLISRPCQIIWLSFLMKIEGRLCKIVLLDLFFSMCLPPLPYLIYLFTYDSVTDLSTPEPGYILTKFLFPTVGKTKEHATRSPNFFYTASPRPVLLKAFNYLACSQRHGFDNKKRSLCPFFCLNTVADFASLLW